MKFVLTAIVVGFIMLTSLSVGSCTYQPQTVVETVYVEHVRVRRVTDSIYIFTDDTSLVDSCYGYEKYELDMLIEEYVSDKVKSFNYHYKYFTRHRFMTEKDFFWAIEEMFWD